MLKDLFSNRLFIGVLAFFVLCVVGSLLYMQHVERVGAEKLAEDRERLKPLTEKKGQQPSTTEAPIGDTSQGGHWHGDEWHDAPHEADASPTAPVAQDTPPAPRQKPFANFSLDPSDDPVAAAYKRLDYIANNLHEWGQFSPRTLELIDEMTPMLPMEGEGENIIGYLEELSALRDPRSAEILLKYQLESGVQGQPVDDALVAMGPASVPALVARLDDLSGETFLMIPMELLDPIIAEHRSELGGIVEHIIIPKLAAIAKSNTGYQNAARHRVAELQQ